MSVWPHQGINLLTFRAVRTIVGATSGTTATGAGIGHCNRVGGQDSEANDDGRTNHDKQPFHRHGSSPVSEARVGSMQNVLSCNPTRGESTFEGGGAKAGTQPSIRGEFELIVGRRIERAGDFPAVESLG